VWGVGARGGLVHVGGLGVDVGESKWVRCGCVSTEVRVRECVRI